MGRQANINKNPKELITVVLPEEGEYLQLNKIISKVAPGATLLFESGVYQVNETVTLNKSIKMVGKGMDKTIISSNGLNQLVNTSGNYDIGWEGISFITKSGSPTTVMQIKGGTLNVQKCHFSGGIIDQEGNHGIGLFISGVTEIDIERCQFEVNENAGLWIDGQVQGKVVRTTFVNNVTGLAVVGKAKIEALENTFTHNHVSLAYDQFSKGKIVKNSFSENRGGILIKGESHVDILKNTFSKNDGAAGFFENCDVQFEENVISNGAMTLMVRHTAKAVIRKNRIQDNEQGIVCADQSGAEILENTILGQENFGVLGQDESTTYIASNIIRENSAGMKFENHASFTAEKNQITLNHLYGILATGYSKGQIHKNIIEKNNQDPLGWNVEVKESADVDFDDYKKLLPQGIPVPFSLVENQMVVSPLSSNEGVSFTEIVAQCKSGQDLILTEGEYQLSNPIIIDKPINLIAKTPGNVFIRGEDLSQLLIFQGNGELALKGICFSLIGSGQTNVAIIKSGHLIMEQCILEGARDHQGNKRDFGAGLLISGTTSAIISNSVFKGNLLGISAQDKSSITVHENEFSNNFYGITFRDRSTANLSGNEYKQNKGYGLMAYDESEIIITNDINHHNQAGFGLINSAKATIEESKSHDNEIHGFFIDNHASCEIRNSHSHSNEMSGIAIYGDNQSILEGNGIHNNNQAGIESAESAQSIIMGNELKSNSFGILLADNAHSEITGNKIYENEVGIKIQGEAYPIINHNKIFSNAKGGIIDWSNSEPQIDENEIYENGDPSENGDEEQGEDVLGISYGDFLVDLLGSENLSDDPSIAAIPISDTFLEGKEKQGEDDEDYINGDEEDSQKSLKNFKFQILYFEDGELYAEVFQIIINSETTKEWLDQEIIRLRNEFIEQHPNAEILD
jgi:parallel beta-helix repeat protein